jgi:glycerophosphoryl diester phosphodiesterase
MKTALGSQSRTLNIAHRGARSLAPENTLVAANKALELGADMWELDVQITLDGALIVIHDSTLQRTSNVETVFPNRRPWRVREFKLDEIRLLDFGSWFEKQDPFGQIASGVVSDSDLASYMGEPAPTLEEALNFTLAHGWLVNLEIKDLSGTPWSDDIVKKVIDLVEGLNMVDLVLVSSFNQGYLTQVRASHPDIATGVLVSKRHPRPDGLLRQLGTQAYHPHNTAIRSADISLLHSQGFRVHVWNVNDRQTMESMLRAGVSGIFTDFPQMLTSVMADLNGV